MRFRLAYIYRNTATNEVIAYQYGQNPNTRSFIAINVKSRKGAAFFTNSENGMSIAKQMLSSPDSSPIGNIDAVFEYMDYRQSDEPGWKETIEGKIAEDQENFEKARGYFEKALMLSPNDESKKHRLEWFDAVHLSTLEKQEFSQNLELFVGIFNNCYNDEIYIH